MIPFILFLPLPVLLAERGEERGLAGGARTVEHRAVHQDPARKHQRETERQCTSDALGGSS